MRTYCVANVAPHQLKSRRGFGAKQWPNNANLFHSLLFRKRFERFMLIAAEIRRTSFAKARTLISYRKWLLKTADLFLFWEAEI